MCVVVHRKGQIFVTSRTPLSLPHPPPNLKPQTSNLKPQTSNLSLPETLTTPLCKVYGKTSMGLHLSNEVHTAFLHADTQLSSVHRAESSSITNISRSKLRQRVILVWDTEKERFGFEVWGLGFGV